MFEIPVLLWMFIISQIFGAINIIIALIRYQYKDKAKTLRLAAVGNVFKALNYAFLLNWSLAGLKVVSIAKNLIFAKTSAPDSKIKFWQSFSIFIFFCLISVAVVFVTWWFNRLWYEWVILAVVLFANFGKWVKGIHWLRISALFYRTAMIFNSIFFFLNPTNLIKAIVVICSITIFYIRLLAGKIKSKNNASV
ncbi:MAG: YgjV family protein [Firmicutes bacterium]|nr:YgjV family protein [Bacillota bacterium]